MVRIKFDRQAGNDSNACSREVNECAVSLEQSERTAHYLYAALLRCAQHPRESPTFH
jgi:hypothetical protein